MNHIKEDLKPIILFDLGNVVVKPLNTKKVYEFLNTDVPYDNFEKHWNNSIPAIEAHKGLISDEAHIEDIIKFCHSKISVDEFKNKYENMEDYINEKIIKIIKCLKENNYKIGLLSNLRLMDYYRHKECFELIESIGFDYMFLSYEMKCVKPENEIYKKVISKCNVKPENIIFFDDSINNVEGAKKHKINAYQATGNDHNKIIKILNNNEINIKL